MITYQPRVSEERAPLWVNRTQKIISLAPQGTGEERDKRERGFDLVEHPLVCDLWQGVYFTIYRDGRPRVLFHRHVRRLMMTWPKDRAARKAALPIG
jgi:hypothetical protein